MSALNNQSVKNTLEKNLSRKMETGYIENEAQLLGKQPLAHQNPLDRNGDGKVDLRDLATSSRQYDEPMLGQRVQSIGQTSYVQSNQRASLGLVRSEPIIKEVIQKDAVIREHIHPVQKEEIQPIIYREREQLDIKQVTQLLHETRIQPTIMEQRQLPAEYRSDIIERGAPIVPNNVLPTTEVMSTTRTQQINAPIVQETIKKTILEEIQPVLERDVYQSTLIQNTQPIYEKIIEAPRISREIRDVGNVDMSGRRLAQNLSTFPAGFNNIDNQRLSQNLSQRRLSQTFEQPIYNEPLLTNRGLQGVQSQNLPLTQGQGYAPVQGNRLSQNYNQSQLIGQQPLSQNFSDSTYQNRRLSQNMSQAPFGVNMGPAPMAGMNNTGIGLASAVPINTAAPLMSNGMARGFNERSGIYNEGFSANNMVTSVGMNGSHGVVGSVDSNLGNQMSRGSNNIIPIVSVMEQNMANRGMSNYNGNQWNSNASYGLQASPVYQNSVQSEKMREMEREQILRQQNPLGYNAM